MPIDLIDNTLNILAPGYGVFHAFILLLLFHIQYTGMRSRFLDITCGGKGLFCKNRFDFVQILDKTHIFHLGRVKKSHFNHVVKLSLEMVVITV